MNSMLYEPVKHIESLEKFQLAYEHDRTWREAKKAVKARAVKE